MYELTESEIQKILDVKKSLSEIHQLIKDKDFRKKLQNYKFSENAAISIEKLFFSIIRSAQPNNHIYEHLYLNGFLKTLNFQLGILNKHQALSSSKTLKDKLFNQTQFANTISEIALATYLINTGWNVKLEKKFFGGRDVDIFAYKDQTTAFIEIINLNYPTEPIKPSEPTKHSEPTKIPFNEEMSFKDDFTYDSESLGLQNVFVPKDLWKDEEKLVNKVSNKIIEKYNEKFSNAYKQGWTEKSWIALDLAKVEQYNLDASILGGTTSNWRQTIMSKIHEECQHLTGFIIYNYIPTADTPLIIHGCHKRE